MIISLTRHRRLADDVAYTCQFPLSRVKFGSRDDFFVTMNIVLRSVLGVDEYSYSVVWRMSETGQISFVHSQYSFEAAVLDHKNANKKVIQLFVVNNDNVTDLPKLECA